MRQFIFVSIFLAIVSQIAPALTEIATRAGAENLIDWITETVVGWFTEPSNLPQLIEALFWAAIIYFIGRPLFTYPIGLISPFLASIRDTEISRRSRYYGLCFVMFTIPTILVWLYFSVAAYLTDFVFNKPGLSFGLEVTEALWWLFTPEMIAASLASILIGHWILFGLSARLSKLIRFFESSRFGLGGSARFANFVEELDVRFANPFLRMLERTKPTTLAGLKKWLRGKKASPTIFLGNSMFMPNLEIGPQDDRHMITIAGSRSGKGTCAIIPNLLQWQGSMICIDPKGTNYVVTAKRRREMGQNVYVFDPFHERGDHTECYNPLDELDPDAMTIVEDIGVIAEAMVPDEADKKNDHFTKAARGLIAGYIAQVLTDDEFETKSLVEVYDIMNAPPEDQDEVHGRMLDNTACGGLAQEAAARVLRGLDSDEFQSVYATATEQMKWIGSLAMRRVLSHSTCAFAEMREEPTSFYLIIPSQYLRIHKNFQRMIINAAIKAFTKGGRSPVPGLFLIDEAHSLGRMDEIETGYGLLAGYNLFLWTFFQGIGQIKSLYGGATSTMMGCSRAIQVFGVGSDPDSQKYVQGELGRRRIGGALEGIRRAETASLRELNEISSDLGRDGGKCYILRDGKPPLFLRRMAYHDHKRWNDLASPDPDYQ